MTINRPNQENSSYQTPIYLFDFSNYEIVQSVFEKKGINGVFSRILKLEEKEKTGQELQEKERIFLSSAKKSITRIREPFPKTGNSFDMQLLSQALPNLEVATIEKVEPKYKKFVQSFHDSVQKVRFLEEIPTTSREFMLHLLFIEENCASLREDKELYSSIEENMAKIMKRDDVASIISQLRSFQFTLQSLQEILSKIRSSFDEDLNKNQERVAELDLYLTLLVMHVQIKKGIDLISTSFTNALSKENIKEKIYGSIFCLLRTKEIQEEDKELFKEILFTDWFKPSLPMEGVHSKAVIRFKSDPIVVKKLLDDLSRIEVVEAATGKPFSELTTTDPFFEKNQTLIQHIGEYSFPLFKSISSSLKNAADLIYNVLSHHAKFYSVTIPIYKNRLESLSERQKEEFKKYCEDEILFLKEIPEFLKGSTLLANKEFIIKSIKEIPSIIECASDELKEDKEVAQALIVNSDKSTIEQFKMLGNSIKKNPEIAHLAAKRYKVQIEALLDDESTQEFLSRQKKQLFY